MDQDNKGQIGVDMSQLIEFYRGRGKDHAGRTINQILSYDYEEFEYYHDFIQWLFPLKEPSLFNIHAPTLTDQDIATFRGDEGLKLNLLLSLDRFLEHLGLERSNYQINASDHFYMYNHILLTPNHNWLRITRVLKCLSTLGLVEYAESFLRCLKELQSLGRINVRDDSMEYWTLATERA